MKKVLVVLMSIILTFSFAACTESQNVTESVVNKSTQNEEYGNQNIGNSDSYLTQNIADYMGLVKSKLNIDNYNIEDGYGNGTWIKVVSKNDIPKQELKIIVDGVNVSLPVKYTDLIKAGWVDENDIAEFELNKNNITSTVFSTTAGKKIQLWFANTDKESKMVNELEAVKLCITNSSVNGDVYDSPTFNLFNSVSNSTDLAGILDANSTPSYLCIQDNNDPKYVVASTIEYKNDGNNIRLEYHYTNKSIMSITMEYGISNTIISY